MSTADDDSPGLATLGVVVHPRHDVGASIEIIVSRAEAQDIRGKADAVVVATSTGAAFATSPIRSAPETD